MALTTAEYLRFAPRSPNGICVIDDRYVCTVGAEFTVSVFDTVTQSVRAFAVYGNTCVPDGGVFGWDGDLWVIAGTPNSSTRARPILTRIDLATGGGAQYDPGGSEYSRYHRYNDSACTVIGDLCWTSERGYDYQVAGYWDMTTVTWHRMAGVYPILIGSVIYTTGSKKRYNASTGAAMSDAANNFPDVGIGAGRLVDGNIYWYQSGTSLCSWDAVASAEYRPPISYGVGGTPVLGPDGLVYSAAANGVTITDRALGAVLTESLPIVRGERSLLAVAGGDLWTPSGYPLSH